MDDVSWYGSSRKVARGSFPVVAPRWRRNHWERMQLMAKCTLITSSQCARNLPLSKMPPKKRLTMRTTRVIIMPLRIHSQRGNWLLRFLALNMGSTFLPAQNVACRCFILYYVCKSKKIASLHTTVEDSLGYGFVHPMHDSSIKFMLFRQRMSLSRAFKGLRHLYAEEQKGGASSCFRYLKSFLASLSLLLSPRCSFLAASVRPRKFSHGTGRGSRAVNKRLVH